MAKIAISVEKRKNGSVFNLKKYLLPIEIGSIKTSPSIT